MAASAILGWLPGESAACCSLACSISESASRIHRLPGDHREGLLPPGYRGVLAQPSVRERNKKKSLKCSERPRMTPPAPMVARLSLTGRGRAAHLHDGHRVCGHLGGAAVGGDPLSLSEEPGLVGVGR